MMDENNKSKRQNFIKSTKTNSPTGHSRGLLLPPKEDSFMYIDTSQSNSGNKKVFDSVEKTDNIQINQIIFYYNRFPTLTNDS